MREESRVDRHEGNNVPQQGGTLVRRLRTDIVTLNPIRTATANDRYVQKYLYTPIIYLDQNMQPVSGLAKSWTISPDGLVYRFELNETRRSLTVALFALAMFCSLYARSLIPRLRRLYLLASSRNSIWRKRARSATTSSR